MSRNERSTIDRNKYKNSVLYFIENCNNNSLGTTKMNKLLYYLDFISYRDKGSSVTGDTYRHLEKGPVPKMVVDIIQDLQKDKAISVKEVPYKDGKTVDFSLLTEPDTSVFDGYEKQLLESICRKFKLWSTSKIVDQTHLESPWLYSKMMDDVDYEYAYDIDIIPSSELVYANR